jgi:hypothetical protein
MTAAFAATAYRYGETGYYRYGATVHYGTARPVLQYPLKGGTCAWRVGADRTPHHTRQNSAPPRRRRAGNHRRASSRPLRSSRTGHRPPGRSATSCVATPRLPADERRAEGGGGCNENVVRP